MRTSEIRTLARRYARGLVEASAKDLGRTGDALDGWAETSRRSPDLMRILSEPRISRDVRAALAQEIFQKLNAPEPLLRMMTMLIDDNRLAVLRMLRDAFIEEREKRENVQCVVVESSIPLTDSTRERIRSRVAEFIRNHVRIEERVNPRILGGVNIRVGSRVWYGSARSRLKQVFR